MTLETATVVEHVIGTAGRFSLQSRSGDVRLRGIDGDVVRLRSRDGRSLDGLAVDRTADGLAIGGVRSISVDVEVPMAATVTVETASGDVDATGLTGTQRYRTASGDVDLQAVHGDISIDAVSGDVGLIADGPTSIRARTVSGDLGIRAGRVLGLRAGTTSGDLRLAGRFDGPGPFTIETVSGDATVASADDLRIEVQTITGRIRADVTARLEEASGRRTVVIGSGGPTVDFRSTSGDLRVVPATTLTRRLGSPVTPRLADGFDAAAPADAVEDARLEVLRALERGDISITEAAGRLAELDGDPGVPVAPADLTTPDATEADHA